MKFHLKSPALGALWLAFCLAQPASAQIEKTSVGAINATIDGTPYDGETLDVPAEGTSTAEYRTFGPVTTLTIQAHDPQAESAMHNVLSIEMSIMADGVMDGSSVSWWPEGMGAPFYLSEGSGAEPDLTLDAISLEDGAASIKGSFSARLCRQDSFFAEPDVNDCRSIKGTFDTKLRKAD